jgi:FMN-dependent oxidoreductase (nitrilotriacetate monooxygenase family)
MTSSSSKRNANPMKPIRFNAFVMNTAGHQSPGLWRHPDDQSARYKELRFWTDLAQTLERGGFDSIFFADVMGVYDVYRGTADGALGGAVQVPVNDPMLLIAAMAAVTRDLGFAVTFTLTYEHPVPFARRMSTLDHLTQGRIGWNIVTGYLESAAKNLGLAKQLGHDARYDYAEEYMEVLYKLWESSWEDDAVKADKRSGVFTDPSKVHRIEHQGEHFTVPGIHLSEPSLQRTPVLYQAGASDRGQQFAGRHAECVFISGPTPEIVKKSVDGIRAATALQGRAPSDVKIYAQALIVTDTTEQRAKNKLADYARYIDPDAALALLSGWTGIDFSAYALDQVVEYVENDAGRSALASFTKADPNRKWTVGEVVRFIGLGGRGPVFVGTPAKVADDLESWMETTGIDGFNLAYAINPGSFEDVVDFIVPELRRRGRYAARAGEATLRRHLFGQSDRLPKSHIGRSYPASRLDRAKGSPGAASKACEERLDPEVIRA